MKVLVKKLQTVKTLLILVTLSILTACGGGSGGSSTTTTPTGATITLSPASNASKIPVSLNQITVNFNKEFDSTTINTNTFIVSNGITGVITTSNNNKQATFTPNNTLASNMTYTVTLTGINDANGTSILPGNAQVFSWAFTTCGSTPIATYSVSWSPVNDSDLAGYKVYYGTTTPLTKVNSTSVNLGNVTSWTLNPTNMGFNPCDKVQVAISSVGNTKSESNLSQAGTITID